MDVKILVIGANGQLGSELTPALQKRYGRDQVIASDIKKNELYNGKFEILDATECDQIEKIIEKHQINQIYHLAAILSAKGEENPLHTWDLNMKTWFNVLEVSRKMNISKVFYPSSIAVFGAHAPKKQTPNDAYLDPSTVYGISKVAGENWAQYYIEKYGMDVRSLRFPGIIGYKSMPGGGTTDYAVAIYHSAVQNKDFSCFLEKDTQLPMIFMEDAIRATIELMEIAKEKLTIHTSYNIAGISFSPIEVYNEIKKWYPEFNIAYKPDLRQKIASNWPDSIDDTHASKDWDWKPKFDLKSMTEVMIKNLKEKYNTTQPLENTTS